jgi:hypothetical protein
VFVKLTLIAAVLCALFVSCGRNVHSNDAIRQAVIDHLASRKNLDLDLAAMDVQVTSVNIRESEADATIAFRPKGGDTSAGMSMRYTLELKDNKWAVKTKSETGGSPHGGGAVMGGGADGGQLPAGHPPIQEPTPAPAPE